MPRQKNHPMTIRFFPGGHQMMTQTTSPIWIKKPTAKGAKQNVTKSFVEQVYRSVENRPVYLNKIGKSVDQDDLHLPLRRNGDRHLRSLQLSLQVLVVKRHLHLLLLRQREMNPSWIRRMLMLDMRVIWLIQKRNHDPTLFLAWLCAQHPNSPKPKHQARSHRLRPWPLQPRWVVENQVDG